MFSYRTKSSASIKDDILNFLVNPDNKEGELSSLAASRHVNIEHSICSYYFQQFIDDGLIEALSVTSRDPQNEFLLRRVTGKAILLLFEGGYRAIERRERYKRFGGLFLAAITTVNAILATLVTYLTYEASNQSKELNQQLIVKSNKIASLTKIINAKNKNLTIQNKPITPSKKNTQITSFSATSKKDKFRNKID